MPLRSFALALVLLAASTAPALAQDADDEIVRLPGQGFTKPEARLRGSAPDRLVPGGGLFLSFDANADGRITREERLLGTAAAFTKADANADGALTAFEQIRWAESLPTRDDTLANPVRFDPNLDRRVSVEEFESVIADLATHYMQEGSQDILIADLRAPEPKAPRQDRPAFQTARQARGIPGNP